MQLRKPLFKNGFKSRFFLKMMLSYCVVIFLGLGLTSCLVSSSMVSILSEMQSRFDNEVVQKVKAYSDDSFMAVKRIFARLYQKQYSNGSTSIVDFINPAKEARRNDIAKTASISNFLQDTGSANTFISDIFIIDYAASDIYFYSNAPARYVSLNYDFFSPGFLGMEDTRNRIRIIPNYIPDYISYSGANDYSVISFCLYLFDENSVKFDTPLGMAVINMRSDAFKAAYKDSPAFYGNIYVVREQDGDKVLFDSSGELPGTRFPFERYNVNGLGEIEAAESHIVTKLDSHDTGFTYLNLVDKNVIEAETAGIRASIDSITVACVVLTLAVSFLSASGFARRIKSLANNMRDVENGKLDSEIAVRSDDEIGFLERSFRRMCVRLNEYIKNVYVYGIKTKTAELRALQAQMNPHFLFNTLESIRVTAQMNDDIPTAKMIHLLGKVFRWNIKTEGMFVDLSEEISYVDTFIELQKLRYDNSFGVSVDIEPDALKLGIPKLIIQPLVENALTHGLRNGVSEGHIEISGSLEGGRLILRVRDDGAGMDENRMQEVVKSLNDSESEEGANAIGLKNAHQRITILFGNEYGVKIESDLGKGTTVELTLPALRKEEMERHVQNGIG